MADRDPAGVELVDLYHRTSVAAAQRIITERSMTSRENTAEAYFSNRREQGQSDGYGEAVVHVRVPAHLAELDDEFPDGEQHFRIRVGDLRPEHFVDTTDRAAGGSRPFDLARPWTAGDHQQRWQGYLDPGTGDRADPDTWILRNLVGARTREELAAREVEWVEFRAALLHGGPVPHTFDLDHLAALHRRLFADVYEWAGETRTVDIVKGTPFLPHEAIAPVIGGVADMLREAQNLQLMEPAPFRVVLGEVYNAVNTAHPFREGNGRTQRLFLDDLARGAGYRIDWTEVHGTWNDLICAQARGGNLAPMRAMFDQIVHESPEREARRIARSGFTNPGRRPVSQPWAEQTYRPPLAPGRGYER
ncbi:MAG: Fic/DOC family protein [Sporichthyaceae bacterium]